MCTCMCFNKFGKFSGLPSFSSPVTSVTQNVRFFFSCSLMDPYGSVYTFGIFSFCYSDCVIYIVPSSHY